MNLLLVCRNFFSGGGSAARWRSIADYFSERHKVFVVTNVPKKMPLTRRTDRQIYILEGPLKPMLTIIPFAFLVNVVSMVFFLSRLLSKIDPDAIIVSVPEIEEGIACAIASKRYKRKLIVDVRDVIVEDYVESVYSMFSKHLRRFFELFFSRLLIWAYNSSYCVVTVTPTLKQFLLSDGVKVPIRVIPNGADTTLFHAVTTERKLEIKKTLGFADSFIILYAGAMDVKYYPMDVILSASKVIVKSVSNTRLVLCGPRGRELGKFVRGLGKNICYLGLLKHEDVAEVMRASEIGLISMDARKSTFCALTTKFFEYLASGLPVVAACPRGGELERLITQHQVGYAVTSGDYKSMADRVIRLLNGAAERQIFAQNGIRLVTMKFNRRRLAELYNEVLLEIEKLKV